MALAFYPHTIQVAPATEGVDSQTRAALVPTFGTPVSVRGQLRATTTEAVYKSHAVETRQPHKFLFDLGQEARFQPGNRATLGNRVFSVKTQPSRFDAGDDCDYAVVILEEESLAE